MDMFDHAPLRYPYAHGRLDEGYVKDLASLHKTIRHAIKKCYVWHKEYDHGRPYWGDLVRMAIAVFGVEEIRFLLRDTVYNRYLGMLTLLNWTMALIEYHKHGKRILFSEVRALNHAWGVEGGFIDAIEVVSIQGRIPGKRERE